LELTGKGKAQSAWKAGEWPVGSDKLFTIVKTAFEDGEGRILWDSPEV
jgi:hypothetical protein